MFYALLINARDNLMGSVEEEGDENAISTLKVLAHVGANTLDGQDHVVGLLRLSSPH